VARAAADLQLDYVVLTSVTRDDLPDGGAGAFARTIQRLRQALPGVGVEVLVPDFQGDPRALDTVLGADPDVFNHNLETVPRLCPAVRPQASVARSLEILGRAAAARPAMPVKSGLMLGLGETEAELLETFDRLVAAGCSLLTLGQYLQPTPAHLPVASYLPPEAFDRLQHLALERGFAQVISGPLVRSSYQAKALAARDRLEARDSTQPLDPPPAPG
jgi:lipoic acid synthetase